MGLVPQEFITALKKYLPRERIGEVAEDISCNPKYLEKIYNGEERPKRGTLNTLVVCLGLSYDEIRELYRPLGFEPLKLTYHKRSQKAWILERMEKSFKQIAEDRQTKVI